MRGQAGASRKQPTRVLVVDDQSLYREGLCEIMGHWPEFEVVGEAGDGWGAVTACRKLRPDLVVMDNKMPMMDGIEATRRIVSEQEGVIVVMLSASIGEGDVLGAFDSGARGFALKEVPSRQLRALLKEAVRSDIVVSGSVAEWLVSHTVSKSKRYTHSVQDAADIPLDAEEKDVMALVAQGLSNEDIGARLYISPGSVKKRLRTIMGKLGLENRVQVAVYAVRKGMDRQ